MKLLKLYANEKYILMLNSQGKDLKVFVSFKVFKKPILMENFEDYLLVMYWLVANS